jgi:Tfp pilus assembly protein PilV
MLRLICDKKGESLVEVLIAIFLTTTCIMGLLSLQDTGWKTMARTDYLGRASGILYKTLENQETLILNPCNTVTLGDQTTQYVKVSGQSAAISGDVTYTVNTHIDQDIDPTTGLPNPKCFVIMVTVTWPPINTSGIKESMTVRRQEANRFPDRCPDA